MLPHLYPFTWESRGTNWSLDLIGWLFCQESACTAPGCAIAEGLAIATMLPGIRSRNTFTRYPNAMQASRSDLSPCQTRCSSIKCSWIKAESQRSFMRVILQTRLSRELQLHASTAISYRSQSTRSRGGRITTPRAASIRAGT